MARLTDTRIRNARAKDKHYKLSDEKGLYLLVTPTGAKYWRLKYRFATKEKLLSLGVYPAVSLAAAREARDQARTQLRAGQDPSAVRKAVRRHQRRRLANSFEALGREWLEDSTGAWSVSHAAAQRQRLERELFPVLGPQPIEEITAADVLDVIRAIEKRGALEIASKTLTAAGQVFRYAVAMGRAASDPTRDLRGALKRRERRHYAKLDENGMPEFLRKVEEYDGSPITRIAIKLLVLTFVRTGELRGAQWSELDPDGAMWRIPAKRMKVGGDHLVPLSRQALALIEELRPLTGHREHLFPNEHHPRKCLSENTILYALYRMGYRGRATGHGFRATASTILHEQEWSSAVIERQLAHKDPNVIRATYNRAEHLPERRKLMQHWADYLDALRAEERVIQIEKSKRRRQAGAG